MSEDYYNGATDALSEAEAEIKAAWVVTPVKRTDFTSNSDFWREVALEALRNLRESYEGDQKFMRSYRARQEAQA